MSKTLTTKNVAAVALGLALVLGLSFAFATPAKAQSVGDLQAQIQALLAQIASLQGGSTPSGSCITFTRNHQMGDSGGEVMWIQQFLNKNGAMVANTGAGSPGNETNFYGSLSRSAVAKFQITHGITPAAGYWGPITRAKANSMCTPGPVTPPGTPTPSPSAALQGGEGNLLVEQINRDVENDVEEGEDDVQVLGLELEAEDSDIRIERVDVEIDMDDAAGNESDNLDDYITEVSLWLDGERLATMDVDDADEDDDVYSFRFNGLNGVIREDDAVDFYVAVTAVNNIDSDDVATQLEVGILDDGIRAVDAMGISETYDGGYNGAGSGDFETFTVGEASVGELSLSESNDDPNATILVAVDDDTSDEFTVFVFEIENDDEEDVLITDITIDVATTTAVGSPAADIRDIISVATLMLDGEEFDGDINADGTIDFEDIDVEIAEDDTLEAELVIELLAQDGNYAAAGEGLTFSLDANDVTAEGTTTDDDATVSGDADGNAHTIALAGINVVAGDTDAESFLANTASDSYGTFTIEFSVTAVEEDAFIRSAAASTTIGANVGVVYDIDGTTWPGGTESAVLTSSAPVQGNFYRVDEGETETFTLTVTLNPLTAGTFALELEAIGFNEDEATADTTYTIDADDQDFQTDNAFIQS